MTLDEAIEILQPRPAAYVLQPTAGGRSYTGACRDLIRRMLDHRAGRVSRTKNHRPLRLVHFRYFDDYSAALVEERFLKSGAGRQWLRDHLAAELAPKGLFAVGEPASGGKIPCPYGREGSTPSPGTNTNDP